MAFVSFAVAAVAPRGMKGFVAFMQAPPGLAVVALALVALGLSVEETGTIRRIRLGIAMRLVAVAMLVLSVLWACWLGSPLPSLAITAFIIGGMGAIGVIPAFLHDWSTFADVRHGQPIKLLELSRSGVEIETNGVRTTVAITDILAVRAVENMDGRGVIFLVKAKEERRTDMEDFPWAAATPEGDAFVLTEHQAGMDAYQIIARIVTMTAGGRQESGR